MHLPTLLGNTVRQLSLILCQTKTNKANTTNSYQTPNTYSILINVNIFQTGLSGELMQRWLFWYFKMKR